MACGALITGIPTWAGTNAEEARLATAAGMPDLGAALRAPEELLLDPVRAAEGIDAKLTAARQAGQRLWHSELERVQRGDLDDRPLYWRRLAARKTFRDHCRAPLPCSEVLVAFERASRGVDDLVFPPGDYLRVAISGFDPFNLDARIGQSNPSGVAALSLNGLGLQAGVTRARVQAVMLPVRFADFDQGLVEEIFEDLVAGDRLDMLVTISMGRDQFDLERFPGRRRSSPVPDNLGVLTGASPAAPLVPALGDCPLTGPEFLEFSLPVQAMTAVQGPYRVRDNRTVATLEGGTFEAASLQALAGHTAVSGSGGGYLSNEVSYRTVRLVRGRSAGIPVGHIHTPRIAGHDPGAIQAINDQLRRLLEAAIGAAGATP